jgi:hypothetical protein
MRLTKQTYWLREAVVAVLLENDWLPHDVGVSAYDVASELRKRVEGETRNHKLIGHTEVNGHWFDSLDRPVRLSNESEASLGDIVVATSLYSVEDGDTRLQRFMSRLNDDERAILQAYSLKKGSWGDAALAVGLTPRDGELLRRKAKRHAGEQRRRDQARAS